MLLGLMREQPFKISGVHTVVTISTDVLKTCQECHKPALDGIENFDGAVAHMLGHDYKLLHVGTQTIASDKGEPWHLTVAVLGKGGVRPLEPKS